jgi:hypothetical protein
MVVFLEFYPALGSTSLQQNCLPREIQNPVVFIVHDAPVLPAVSPVRLGRGLISAGLLRPRARTTGFLWGAVVTRYWLPSFATGPFGFHRAAQGIHEVEVRIWRRRDTRTSHTPLTASTQLSVTTFRRSPGHEKDGGNADDGDYIVRKHNQITHGRTTLIALRHNAAPP